MYIRRRDYRMVSVRSVYRGQEGEVMTDAIKYHETWTDTHEINFINNLGMGKYIKDIWHPEIQRLSNKEIIESLELYIKGAHRKDWDRAGLSEGKCIKAAQDRIKILKNNGGKG